MSESDGTYHDGSESESEFDDEHDQFFSESKASSSGPSSAKKSESNERADDDAFALALLGPDAKNAVANKKEEPEEEPFYPDYVPPPSMGKCPGWKKMLREQGEGEAEKASPPGIRPPPTAWSNNISNIDGISRGRNGRRDGRRGNDKPELEPMNLGNHLNPDDNFFNDSNTNMDMAMPVAQRYWDVGDNIFKIINHTVSKSKFYVSSS